MSKSNKTIYIDAMALVPERKSGVGYCLEQTLLQLKRIPEVQSSYTVNLIVTLGKAKYLERYLSTNVKVQTIYLPARVMEVLLRINIFPPVDWFLGKGVYIFPNYRNWPLWRSRSITYIYDVGFKKFPEMVQPKNLRYLDKYIPRWLSRTDRIATISEQMKGEVEKYLGVAFTNIDLLYCGVDKTLFHTVPKNCIVDVKKKYDIPYDKYFLFVGNIEPRKNLLRLVEAYLLLPHTIRNDYGLVIVGGDGWLNEEFFNVLNKAQKNGEHILKVKKYVTTSDLPALYCGATALIHPAVYEGFGIPPLEAMACETPVLVSDVPALREVAGEAGYYFDPYDPLSINKTMRSILASDNTKLSQKRAIGKHRANVLSWQNTAQSLLTVVKILEKEGLVKRPILRKVKRLYNTLDRIIRQMFGERMLSAYQPADATDVETLRASVYQDFLNEQPTQVQTFGLRAYLGAKHQVSAILRRMYKNLRSRNV